MKKHQDLKKAGWLYYPVWLKINVTFDIGNFRGKIREFRIFGSHFESAIINFQKIISFGPSEPLWSYFCGKISEFSEIWILKVNIRFEITSAASSRRLENVILVRLVACEWPHRNFIAVWNSCYQELLAFILLLIFFKN